MGVDICRLNLKFVSVSLTENSIGVPHVGQLYNVAHIFSYFPG
jgi:hypothetical protein